MTRYFVTGTDTEVGKTYVCEMLLRAAAHAGKRSLGLKPVAAGAELNSEGVYENEDALRLMAASSVKLPYEWVNPVCVPDPLSPHIAAERSGVDITVSSIRSGLQQGLHTETELTLVEGAGGWRVPINREQTMADLAKSLCLPVILVVGMRLGCINHALLSAESIAADGLVLYGWFANHVDNEMGAQQENVNTLERMLSAPLLGRIASENSVLANSRYSEFANTL